MSAIDRGSGVLLHISTLHGEFSCGSFGKEALSFVDFLADAGFSYWQVLPFCIPDECGSPYKSVSAFAGNPAFIDLPTLFEEGLLTAEELEHARQKTPYAAELSRLNEERETLLRRAARRATNRREILSFVHSRPKLDEACRFLALKKVNGGVAWQKFTVTRELPEDYFYFAFTQFQFHRQWERIKAYANQKGVRLIGDLPIYVAEDSADVYFHQEEFLLDENGRPAVVAGVPPDYFSVDGQMWGNPLYNWERMQREDFSWWRERMEHMLTLFDGVRFDHFRGVESYWSIPRDAVSAKEGHWEKGPGMALVAALQKVAGERLIIAEDLGDITPEVAKLVQDSGFPGMRVFQFAFLSDYHSPHLPHSYPAHCVAYTGTHDNNTLLGFVWEQDPQSRRRMLDYCNYTNPDWDHCYDAILRTMLQSHAALVIFPVQDLLGYGSDTRMNTPGHAEGNWTFRITGESLAAMDRRRFRHLNEIYGRI